MPSCANVYTFFQGAAAQRHIAASMEESMRDHFLREIPTIVVGFTPMLTGSAYLIVNVTA
jgi:hypothetical protein